ncbi:MAG: T9SS type A sorting domain-containing protein [Saprospiraceae bacterium]
MKINFLLVLAFTCCIQIVYGQISCEAPDSIKEKYRDDADRLALEKINRENLTYKDSVFIPQVISDTFLNALIAVYNAIDIPERDTVISMFDIHVFPTMSLDQFLVAADSNLLWMKNLHQGIIPTGYHPLDSLIEIYDLSIDEYDPEYNWFFYHVVYFKSSRNYNIPALADLFDALPEVHFAEPTYGCCDGNTIHEPFFEDELEGIGLVYFVGWGDCPAGCTGGRSWYFRIYDDCTVDFIQSFGQPLPYTRTEENPKVSVKIWPNPFNDFIEVDGIQESFQYSILNSYGQQLIKGKFSGKGIMHLDIMNPGIYLLTIQSNHLHYTFKIIKV